MNTVKLIGMDVHKIRIYNDRRWRFARVVWALQAARFVSLIVAVTVLEELRDLRCFDNSSQLAAYLSLEPSELSSGESIKKT